MAIGFNPLRLFGKKHTKAKQMFSKESINVDTSLADDIASTEDFLGKQGAGDGSIEAESADIVTISTDDMLAPNALTSPEDGMRREQDFRRLALENHIKLRTWLLATVILPMAVIPIWLMCLLTEPVLNPNSRVKQEMQFAYLAAIATDVFGLYQIVIRNLFPDGKSEEKRKP